MTSTEIEVEIWYCIEILAHCCYKITLHSKTFIYYDNNGYEKKVLAKLNINQNNFLARNFSLCLFAPCVSENA